MGSLLTKSANIVITYRTVRVRQKLFEAEFQSENRLSARQELPALIPVGLYVSPSLSQFNNLSPV